MHNSTTRTAQQIQTMRTAGQISGGISLICGLIIIYALTRLLTSSTHNNKHHPKLTGMHSYFTLLLISTVGDCIYAFSTSVFALTLPPVNLTVVPSQVRVQIPSCVAQGFTQELGATVSMVFIALASLEMYNLRPRITNTEYVFDATIPIWQRHLTKLLIVGFAIVLLQVVLAGELYGYGSIQNPGLKPWCWLKGDENSDEKSGEVDLIGIYVLVFCSICMIVGFTCLYLRYIHIKLLRVGNGNGNKKRARRTFIKLAVFPLIYLIAWIPWFIHRFSRYFWTVSTHTHVVIDTINVVSISSIGMFNFIFLSCMNKQVRNFLPGWNYCCVGERDPVHSDSRTLISTSSLNSLTSSLSAWDSSSVEEEDGGEYIQM